MSQHQLNEPRGDDDDDDGDGVKTNTTTTIIIIQNKSFKVQTLFVLTFADFYFETF